MRTLLTGSLSTGQRSKTIWLSHSCGGVWPCRHNLTCDIMVGPSCHIHKAKTFLHTFGHSLGEAMEFLTDIFFESLPSRSPHLLDLPISVTIQRRCVRSTHLKRMRADPLQRDFVLLGIIELFGSFLQRHSYFGVSQIMLFAIYPIC